MCQAPAFGNDGHEDCNVCPAGVDLGVFADLKTGLSKSGIPDLKYSSAPAIEDAAAGRRLGSSEGGEDMVTVYTTPT